MKLSFSQFGEKESRCFLDNNETTNAEESLSDACTDTRLARCWEEGGCEGGGGGGKEESMNGMFLMKEAHSLGKVSVFMTTKLLPMLEFLGFQ